MRTYLDFEKPIAELDARLVEARDAVTAGRSKAGADVSRLEARLERAIEQTYRKLSAWQRTQLARHPDRPRPTDYVQNMVEGAIPLGPGARVSIRSTDHRNESEQPAEISSRDGSPVGGEVRLGRVNGFSAVFVATDDIGQSPPISLSRLLRLAESWRLPMVRIVASAPQSMVVPKPQEISADVSALLATSARLVSVCVGEVSGSHSVPVMAAETVLMLENAAWSLVAPEAAANDLWRDGGQAKVASEALRRTSADLLPLRLVTAVVPEPPGGAHRDPRAAFKNLATALTVSLDQPGDIRPQALRRSRADRLRSLGVF